MPFEPGNTFGTAGRPKSLRTSLEARFGKNASAAWDVLERIMNGQLETVQEHMRPDGRLVEIVRRPTIAERKEAAETIIAYTEGKPAQKVQVTTDETNPKALPDAQLEERVLGILARFAERRAQDRALPPAKPST